MAAAPDRCAPELVDLSRLRPADLEGLLEEENLAWRSALSWDLSASMEVVRRFLRMQALSGYALMIGGEVAGYSYYVCEDRKGLLGNLYVARGYQGLNNENLLLTAVLQAMSSMPGVERIEAQLMLMRGPFERTGLLAGSARIYPRQFMMIDLEDAGRLPAAGSAEAVVFRAWDRSWQDEAAALIASAYSSHVDSAINDQYRSYHGARRFLNNIVQYPGCGQFFAPASLVAIGRDKRLAGLALASTVAADTGHITQICVAPDRHGRGLGYELLRRSLRELAAHGCEKASLTVTTANKTAVQLYARMGFRAVRRFAAYVWEGL